MFSYSITRSRHSRSPGLLVVGPYCRSFLFYDNDDNDSSDNNIIRKIVIIIMIIVTTIMIIVMIKIIISLLSLSSLS